MKNTWLFIPSLAVVLVLTIIAQPLAAGKKSGGNMDGYVASLPTEPLSATEREGLLFMFEEEKLARDVYSALNTTWNDRVFANIAASEQQHMDSIRGLLAKYSIPVPADISGEYDDPRIRALYDQLTGQGGKSLVDALIVGATIEDLDISDLKMHLAETDNRDIRVVYQNLMKGSRNHLRSFSARLTALNTPYTAQYLSEDEIQDIVSTNNERGMLDENGQPVR